MKKILMIVKFILVAIVSCASMASGTNTVYAASGNSIRNNTKVGRVINSVRVKIFNTANGIEIKREGDSTPFVTESDLNDITPSSGSADKFNKIGVNTFTIDSGADVPVIKVPATSRGWSHNNKGDIELEADWNTE
jgi:hypothetical protein